MKSTHLAIAAAALTIALAAGWYVQRDGGSAAAANAGNAGGAGGGKGGDGPPTVVNVITPVRQDVPVTLSASGTVTPVSSVVLHAQTSATIRKVHIREGQFVKAGTLMFSLDDRDEQAGVARASAQLARERAALADLERQYKRSQDLYAQKFIAQSAVDTLKSQVDAARAGLGAGAATLQAERVSASYNSIRAPLSGRVGAINVYPGSLVTPALALTSVTQLDPINIAFTLPESALGGLLAAQRAGKVAVEAGVGAESRPVTGHLSFIDNTVDPQAGSIRVKAQFDNRDSLLWPGQFATTSVAIQTLRNAVVIPQAAIITNTRGTSVYVVEKGAAVSRPIARLHVFGINAAVSGLEGNEQVITEGKQNLRPGGKVKLAAAGKADAKDAKDGKVTKAAEGKGGK